MVRGRWGGYGRGGGGSASEDPEWFWGQGQVAGACATLNKDAPRPRHVPRREFPPGIHGAAPGPSHEEDAPAAPKRAAPKLAAPKARR